MGRAPVSTPSPQGTPGEPTVISILSAESHHPQSIGHCGRHSAPASGRAGNGLASSAADPKQGYFCRNLHTGVILDVWRKKLVGRDKLTTGQIPYACDRDSMPVSLFLKRPVWLYKWEQNFGVGPIKRDERSVPLQAGTNTKVRERIYQPRMSSRQMQHPGCLLPLSL